QQGDRRHPPPAAPAAGGRSAARRARRRRDGRLAPVGLRAAAGDGAPQRRPARRAGAPLRPRSVPGTGRGGDRTSGRGGQVEAPSGPGSVGATPSRGAAVSDLSPRMAVAFADLRADSQFVPDAARRSRARVAMHEARAEHASRPALAAWWETVRRPLRVAAPVVAVAGATWLLMAGWSAPAGTPLHPLRLAREEAQLA